MRKSWGGLFGSFAMLGLHAIGECAIADYPRLRDTLAERRRKSPDLNEWHTKTKDQLLREENEIVVAILGATIIDEQLTDAIESRFVKDFDETIAKKFFGPPLGFSNKIRLGYLLGLYPQPFLKDMLAIAWIRNRFAHDLALTRKNNDEVPVSFETEELTQKCKDLTIPDATAVSRSRPSKPRERFLIAVMELATALAVTKT
jgi:hypothetical protein